MIVVDASALANALTVDGPVGDAARHELERDVHWAGPEHLIAETFSAVRGRYVGSKITRSRAHEAINALGEAAIELLRTAPLLPRMWELRDNVSGYDAAYVAAAEVHDCSLVTADARLKRASGPKCDVRLAIPAATGTD